ncbi:MAG: pilus assembly protein TadG [Hyphomicrobiales bacterium]|nr:pilus assembly protein TadG [Hyphomicrobiales bacterium]
MRPAARVPGFVRDRRGAAAVEFSLVVLPFLGVIFVIMEIAFNAWATSSLDNAVRAADRQIQLGVVSGQGMSSEDFRSSICAGLPGFMPCKNLFVAVDKVDVNNFASTFTASTSKKGKAVASLERPSTSQGSNAYCPGAGGDYIVVRALFAVPSIVGFGISSKAKLNGSTVHLLDSAHAFRNEPFTTGGASC